MVHPRHVIVYLFHRILMLFLIGTGQAGMAETVATRVIEKPVGDAWLQLHPANAVDGLGGAGTEAGLGHAGGAWGFKGID